MQTRMSALPPKADMCGAPAYVCFVPIADILFGREQGDLTIIPATWFCAGRPQTSQGPKRNRAGRTNQPSVRERRLRLCSNGLRQSGGGAVSRAVSDRIRWIAIDYQAQEIWAGIMTADVGNSLGGKNSLNRSFGYKDCLAMRRASDHLSARVDDEAFARVLECRQLAVTLRYIRMEAHTCRGDDITGRLRSERARQ